MKNYQHYSEMLKNRVSKKLDNNTYLTRDNDLINVRLHDTNILTFAPDNSIKFNSGGWKTRTTKDRLNTYQDLINICQNKNLWYFYFNDKQIIFNDLMTIKNKKIIGAKKEDKKDLKLLSKIDVYAKNFVSKLFEGKIDQPGTGDCWYCAMKTNEGQNLGEATKNKDHLLSHLKENYFVPSLLLNAIKFNNLFDWLPFQNTMYYIYTEKNMQKVNEWPCNIAKTQIIKSIKKYLRFQLL